MSALSRVETAGASSRTTETDAEAEPTAERPSGPSETSEEGPTGLSRGRVFELLSAERRCEILEKLDEEGGSTTIGELAEHIASKENGTDPGHLSSDQRKRVYIGLYQCHLPKLDDANVIDYDRDRGDVELGPGAARLFAYLSLDPAEATRDERGGESEDAPRPVGTVYRFVDRYWPTAWRGSPN
ncbi:DUF7344 domain-containing protein [Halorarum salinum]|uniref:DUF7344 domain-containing protein n=1 Tax=Halorarum salinum TaxID=2743089 RepID=A0A7D5Q8X1_9EURY|nr:hypothetical protein [Halobaculum salinum]QLG60538.1 hypothetical protein HUG12_01765 [Halobaculum salinum]